MDGIDIDGEVHLISLGLLSVTDTYIPVASKSLDELKVYLAICSLDGLYTY